MLNKVIMVKLIKLIITIEFNAILIYIIFKQKRRRSSIMENGIKVSFKYSGISNFQILKYSEDVKKYISF